MAVYVNCGSVKWTGIDDNGGLVMLKNPPNKDRRDLWKTDQKTLNAKQLFKSPGTVKYVEIIKKSDSHHPIVWIVDFYDAKADVQFKGDVSSFLKWLSERKEMKKPTVLVFYDLVKLQENMEFPIYSLVDDLGTLIFDLKLFTKNIGLESRLAGKNCSIETIALPHHKGVDFPGQYFCLWSIFNENMMFSCVKENRNVVFHFMAIHDMLNLFIMMCMISKSSWNTVMKTKGLGLICENVFQLFNDMKKWTFSKINRSNDSSPHCATGKRKREKKFQGGVVVKNKKKGFVKNVVNMDFASMYLECALRLPPNILPDFKRKSIEALLDMKYNSSGTTKNAAKAISVNIFGNSGKEDSCMYDLKLASSITELGRKCFNDVKKYIEDDLDGEYFLGHTDGFSIGLKEYQDVKTPGKHLPILEKIVKKASELTNGLVLKVEYVGPILILSSTNYVIRESKQVDFSSCNCPDQNCGNGIQKDITKNVIHPKCLTYSSNFTVKGGLLGKTTPVIVKCLYETVFFPWIFSLHDDEEENDCTFLCLSYDKLIDHLNELSHRFTEKIQQLKDENVWHDVIFWSKYQKISNDIHKDSFPSIHKCYRETHRTTVGKKNVNLVDYLYGKEKFNPNPHFLDFLCEISKICVSLLNIDACQSNGKSHLASNIVNVLDKKINKE